MKELKKNLKIYLKIFFSLTLILAFFPKTLYSNDINIEIIGNDFTDKDVILSLIKNKPENISEEYSNYLIKTLDNSKLFEDVSVKIVENRYLISVTEFININKIYFKNNERLKDEELEKILEEFDLNNMNPILINKFIFELKKIYESFGYNNSKITYYENFYDETNTTDLYFEINEGDITKINKIIFDGNNNINSQTLKSVIKSKTKTLKNIFANNNFKQFAVENDVRRLSNHYINEGYRDIEVKYNIEFLNSNKVNLYFFITEGPLYKFSSIEIIDKSQLIENDLINLIKENIEIKVNVDDNYSLDEIDIIKDIISDILISNGKEFFEINTFEKLVNENVDILYEINSVKPKYVKQINIYGNTRTFDEVIRRELELSEGDPVHKSQIDRIKKKLRSLNLFQSVEVLEKNIDNDLVDLEINVEEKNTGTVNAGVSVGTLDGFAIVAGLSERNFNGSGRSLKTLLNTSEDKTEFTFQSTDRILYENDVDLSYKANYKEQNFSTRSSYKLNTFTTGFGVTYKINPKIRHNINIDYVIKDYTITDDSTVAAAIGNSSGENVSFVLSNNVFYNTVNPGFQARDGDFISFNNFIETPTSSSNGYIKNILTLKKYNSINKNTFSIQGRLGNIFSLSNNDILTDDKFSLGGRWLRGFDIAGAGPRNSRTSYVGGNNLVVTKLDYSREILNNSNFPILFNIFNDYGLVWENKTKPTNDDNSLRASAGFGIKYYSPIGPIGFSWGFPILDEEYDIKRMFLFSVGNID